MAYNEQLAQRMRAILQPLAKHIEEKKMFGGLAFMYKDKMACGIVKDELMVRVVPGKFAASLQHPAAREMDFTGKTLKNFLYISPEGFRTEAELSQWIELGIEHAGQAAG